MIDHSRQAFREFDEPVENRSGEVIGLDEITGNPWILIDTAGLPPSPWRTHLGTHDDSLKVIADAYRIEHQGNQQEAVDLMCAAIASFEAANDDELKEAELHRQINDLDIPAKDDLAVGIGDNYWPVEAALSQLIWHRNWISMTYKEQVEHFRSITRRSED
jgi:hypothetical protein